MDSSTSSAPMNLVIAPKEARVVVSRFLSIRRDGFSFPPCFLDYYVDVVPDVNFCSSINFAVLKRVVVMRQQSC